MVTLIELFLNSILQYQCALRKRQCETENFYFRWKRKKRIKSWNGIDKATDESHPKFNYSGAVYDANWENIIDFYAE